MYRKYEVKSHITNKLAQPCHSTHRDRRVLEHPAPERSNTACNFTLRTGTEPQLALVAFILSVAAPNRWWSVPALRWGHAQKRFGRILRVQALLLVGTLAATGLLTTIALPHD